MTLASRFSLLATCAVLGLAMLSGVHAQDSAVKATINDPPGALPDPSHIPIVLPQNIQWKGEGGEQTATLYGDPNKPGPYGVLIKWLPGSFSHPHFHGQQRYIYVVSGTWWVNSGNVYDERKTYPIPAGSFVMDVANTVHWDGNRTGAKEPTVLLITGIGPAGSTQVDNEGKPKPRVAGRD